MSSHSIFTPSYVHSSITFICIPIYIIDFFMFINTLLRYHWRTLKVVFQLMISRVESSNGVLCPSQKSFIILRQSVLGWWRKPECPKNHLSWNHLLRQVNEWTDKLSHNQIWKERILNLWNWEALRSISQCFRQLGYQCHHMPPICKSIL